VVEKSKSSPEHLMEVFDFTPEDLEANAAGTLSEREQLKLINEQKLHRVLLLFPLITGISLLAIGLFDGVYLLFCPGLFAVMLSLLFGLALVYQDISAMSKVYSICGTVMLKNYEEISHLYINHVEFTLTPNKGHALVDGEAYCIYYTKYMGLSNRILSIQQLSKPKEAFFE